jgi:hypothetical protein
MPATLRGPVNPGFQSWLLNYNQPNANRVDMTTRDDGSNFVARNELERLEVTSANEQQAAQERLDRQFTGLEDMANRVGEEEAVAKKSEASLRRSQLDEEQFARATRGMDLSDRQKKAAGRQQTLRRSLNRAMASNDTRRGFKQRSEAAMGAGGSFSDALFGQNMSGQGALAGEYTSEKIASDSRRSSREAGGIATAAKVAGMAAMFLSSEKAKHDHGREADLLKKLKKVRVNRWQYKDDDKTHVGPFAEEFNREFGIDTEHPNMISVIDALGVTLGAVKELDEKVSNHGR